jgi:muconolactone delta-isomerase
LVANATSSPIPASILAALPLAPWMTVDTTPLSPHPSDPAIMFPPTALRTDLKG